MLIYSVLQLNSPLAICNFTFSAKDLGVEYLLLLLMHELKLMLFSLMMFQVVVR